MQPPSKNMLSSQKTIGRLQSEILELKLENHKLKLRAVSGVDETKRDFLAEICAQNEELRKRLEEYENGTSQAVNLNKTEQEREIVEKRDATSQTYLDRYNVDLLIEASLTLKRQKRERDSTFKRPNEHHTQQTPSQHQTQSQHHHHAATMPRPQQTQPKVVSQLTYPHVTLPKQTVQTAVQPSSKLMTFDEKEVLQKLFRVDGVLTTLRDQLRAQQN